MGSAVLFRQRQGSGAIGIRLGLNCGLDRDVGFAEAELGGAEKSRCWRTFRLARKCFRSGPPHKTFAAGLWRASVRPVKSRRILRTVPSPKPAFAAIISGRVLDMNAFKDNRLFDNVRTAP